jgi:hypothetical protein
MVIGKAGFGGRSRVRRGQTNISSGSKTRGHVMVSVSCNNSSTSSCHLLRIIMVEESTQHCVTTHRCQRRRLIGILKAQRDTIAKPLMGSVLIVMMFDLPENVPKMLSSQENQVVQSLPAFSDEPLGVGIARYGSVFTQHGESRVRFGCLARCALSVISRSRQFVSHHANLEGSTTLPDRNRACASPP